jgi:hypothetical protein
MRPVPSRPTRRRKPSSAPPQSPDSRDNNAAARRGRGSRAPVRTPDSRDNNRAAREPKPVTQPSPDAQDVAGRSPRQHAHDRKVSADAIRAERLAHLRETRKPFSLRRVLEKATASQRPNVLAVSGPEAARLRKQGKTVYSGRDVGATLLPKDDFAASGVARAGEATVLGIMRDPRHALPATAKGFKDAALGAPGAIVKTILDPKGTLSEQAKDYRRRYGGINSPGGVERMARRVSKEGAAPEIFDATMAGVPIAKGIDLGLGRLGRAGRLGEKARRATTATRPGVRTSGATTLAQDTPKGLVAAVRAQRRDRAAARAVQREIDHADGQARRRASREVEGAGRGRRRCRTRGRRARSTRWCAPRMSTARWCRRGCLRCRAGGWCRSGSWRRRSGRRTRGARAGGWRRSGASSGWRSSRGRIGGWRGCRGGSGGRSRRRSRRGRTRRRRRAR